VLNTIAVAAAETSGMNIPVRGTHWGNGGQDARIHCTGTSWHTSLSAHVTSYSSSSNPTPTHVTLMSNL